MVTVGTEGDLDPRGVFDNPENRRVAARLGLGLFCIVLGMLFGGVIIALLVLRFDEAAWPDDLPPLPWQTWLSTGLLLIESWLLVQAGRRQRPVRWLACAFIAALLFMAAQAWAWWDWDMAVDADARRTAVTALWVAGGVHGAHVLGGLVPLGILLWIAAAGRWHARHDDRLRLTAGYWHFLDAVWIALVVTLLIVL